MPESGGPLASRQRQGRPSVTIAAQQDSVGGTGLKGATAALHGISCTSDEKNVLLHPPTLLPRVTWVEVVAGPLAVK